MIKKDPRVSLIIPTYKREKILCDTINFAIDQDFSDYEVIVIDQTEAHDLETQKYFNRLPALVRIIKHNPPSLTGARNRGILEARGEIVVMIDDDVIIKRDFIKQHLKYYDDSDVVGVTGQIQQQRKFVNKTMPFIKDEFLQWVSPLAFSSKNKKEAFRLAGGNFSVRKKSALQVGLFDENFIGTAWGEEIDFSLRLRLLNKKLIYNPDAYIYHLCEKNGGVGNRARFSAFSVYTKSYNLAYLIEKNDLNKKFYPLLIWYIYRPLFCKKDYLSLKGVGFIIRGQVLFLKGFINGFKKGSAVRKKIILCLRSSEDSNE